MALLAGRARFPAGWVARALFILDKTPLPQLGGDLLSMDALQAGVHARPAGFLPPARPALRCGARFFSERMGWAHKFSFRRNLRVRGAGKEWPPWDEKEEEPYGRLAGKVAIVTGAALCMTRTDAICYARNGVRVNAIHPGSTMTELFLKAAETYPRGRQAYLDMMKEKHPLRTKRASLRARAWWRTAATPRKSR